MKEKQIDFFINFRVNVQLLRIVRGISAKELSIALGFNEKRISNFEQSHKPKAEELYAIAKFFDVTAEDIVYKKAKVVLEP